MHSFMELRQFVYRFRMRLFPSSNKRVKRTINEGLPEQLDAEVLRSLCLNHFGAQPETIKHEHLSAWKSSGAYRLFISTQDRHEIRLIFKEAVYSFAEIPALNNFPALPGPPEFTILSQGSGPLAAYLPKVYLAQELEPGHRYIYLLEDMDGSYERCFQPEQIEQSARLLPRFQEAFHAWSEGKRPQGLIEYGPAFSTKLLEYTHASLLRFREAVRDDGLQQVLERWDDIAALHLQPEFFSLDPVPVHGDTNYTNIHLHSQDPQNMKLVDWEWAGYGSPFADLASLLKGEKTGVEEKCYALFVEAAAEVDRQKSSGTWMRGLNPKQCRRLYQWSNVERGLMDAGFLAAQHLETAHQAHFSLPRAVNQSLKRVLNAHIALME